MKKPLLLFLKITISVSIFAFLFYKIYQDSGSFSDALRLYTENSATVLLVLLLMPLNWLMEVLKWKLSIRPLTEITYSEAIAGVFSGIALGFVTPHAVGDYFAKIWSIKHADRKKALGPILVARISQMLPTLLFGLLSLREFLKQDRLTVPLYGDYSSLLIVIVGSILLVLLIIMFVKYGKTKVRLSYYFDLISQLKFKVLTQLFTLSFVRYFIFSVQFLILLSIFDFEISVIDQFMGVAFMFLAKSVLPTFNFFNDLGVREFSAVLYFESMGIVPAPVILAGLILWLINIALPALAGSFFIHKFRIDPS